MQKPTIPTQLSLRPGIFSDWFSFPSFCLCKCYGAREVLQVIFKHILLRKKDLCLQCLYFREGETPRSLTSARWSRPVIALVRVRLTTVVSPRALILGVCASRRITSCPTTASPMFLRSFHMKAVLLSLLNSNSIVTRFVFHSLLQLQMNLIKQAEHSVFRSLRLPRKWAPRARVKIRWIH